MTLGTKIKRVREIKNFTQEHMASEMKISQSQYCRYENDYASVEDEVLQQIADILEVKKEDIQNYEDRYLFSNNTISGNRIGIEVNHNSGDVNHYVIDPKLEALYESKIKLLEEQTKMLQEQIKIFKQQMEK